ncbi:rab-GTPase-TBC domain-containing protein [Blastocladiella britannica]|nr:rab-GTPase-TBC domain-containing protein [Blastocladiella britannica]
MATYRERVALFEHVLAAKAGSIDFERLRRLCYRGIPDTKGIRQRCWKLLLNYLPSDRSEWPATLRTRRAAYHGFVCDFCSVPSPPPPLAPPNHSVANTLGSQSSLTDPPEGVVDNPLAPPPPPSKSPPIPPMSALDHELLDTIDKDVRRTLPSMAFFHNQIFELPNNPLPPCRTFFRSTDAYDKNYMAVERILYIFSKLNPGIGYIQGMNHVVFPIFYLLASDEDFDSKANAEADAFYLFHEVMTDYRDYFIENMDGDATGINNAMDRLSQRLRTVDKDVWRNLESQGLAPAFYSFKWYTCLCAQEFTVPDLLRLWDSLFADRAAARNRGASEAHALRRLIHHNSQLQPWQTPTPPGSTLLSMADDATDPMSGGGEVLPVADTADDLVHASRRGSFLADFAAVLVLHRRSILVSAPFDDALLLLQQPPTAELDALLADAYALMRIPEPDGAAAAMAALTGGAAAASRNSGVDVDDEDDDAGARALAAAVPGAAWMSAAFKRMSGAMAMAGSGTPSTSASQSGIWGDVVSHASLSRQASSESIGHGRSRSFGTWSFGGADSAQAPSAPAAAAPPTAAETPAPTTITSDAAPGASVRRLMHRQSQSFSAMSGMMWSRLRGPMLQQGNPGGGVPSRSHHDDEDDDDDQ